MKIRLGYVANALRLPDSSPSRTVTVKEISKLQDHQDQISRIRRISRENLSSTLRRFATGSIRGFPKRSQLPPPSLIKYAIRYHR